MPRRKEKRVVCGMPMSLGREVELRGCRPATSAVCPSRSSTGEYYETACGWNEAWNTGIEAIDRQHRHLHGLAEELARAIERTNELATLASVLQEVDTAAFMLRELTEYLPHHMETEERYMRLNEYPDYDRHHQEHVRTAKRIDELETLSRRCRHRFSLELAEFFVAGWRTHVLNWDRRLGDFLRERGIR